MMEDSMSGGWRRMIHVNPNLSQVELHCAAVNMMMVVTSLAMTSSLMGHDTANRHYNI